MKISYEIKNRGNLSSGEEALQGQGFGSTFTYLFIQRLVVKIYLFGVKFLIFQGENKGNIFIAYVLTDFYSMEKLKILHMPEMRYQEKQCHSRGRCCRHSHSSPRINNWRAG